MTNNTDDTGDRGEQTKLDKRIEEVDEIRGGHELYKNDVSLTVTFEHLNEPQAIALMAMFDTWHTNGRWGMSRWVSFYADGDGSFGPKPHYDFDGSLIGPDDEEFDELAEAAEVDENKFDFDPVTGWFIDRALELKYEDGE